MWNALVGFKVLIVIDFFLSAAEPPHSLRGSLLHREQDGIEPSQLFSRDQHHPSCSRQANSTFSPLTHFLTYPWYQECFYPRVLPWLQRWVACNL